MELVVELISRNNKVTEFHKFTGNSCVIGRDYNSDLVLLDDHVCAHHASIDVDENGALWISDLQSVNGIKDQRNKNIGNRIQVQHGDIFTIGKQLIRIVLPGYPVAESRRLNAFELLYQKLNHWLLALVVASLLVLSLTLEYSFSETKQLIWSKLAAQSIFVVLLLLIVPAFIAMAARMFKREIKFSASVVFIFSCVLLGQTMSALSSVLVFNYGDNDLVWSFNEAVLLVLMFVFFWGLLFMATNMKVAKVTYSAITTVAVIASLIYMSEQDNDQVQHIFSIETVVMPVNFVITEPTSVADYTKQSGELFVAAANEANKREQKKHDNP